MYERRRVSRRRRKNLRYDGRRCYLEEFDVEELRVFWYWAVCGVVVAGDIFYFDFSHSMSSAINREIFLLRVGADGKSE